MVDKILHSPVRKQTSDEEDPSNPNEDKTYPYLTIYDLMPLHLIPLADAENILIGMGYTAEGVQYHEPLYCYQYTTTNIDTIKKVLDVHKETLRRVNNFITSGIDATLNTSIDDIIIDEDEDFGDITISLDKGRIDLAEMRDIEKFKMDLEHDIQKLQEFYDNINIFKQL